MLRLARARTTLALGAVALATPACWTGAAPAAPDATDPPAAPAVARPARPRACAVTFDPPVAATGLGVLRIELPAGERLARLDLTWTAADGSSGTRIQLGTAMASSITAEPGTYTVEITTASGARTRCAGVEVAAGGATAVAVPPRAP